MLTLRPRSRALAGMLDQTIRERLKSDGGFRSTIKQAVASANLLEEQEFREKLVKGLEELSAEGLIETRGAEEIIKRYI
jgi:hypothetical protein